MIIGISIQQPKNAEGMTLLYNPLLHFLKTYHLFLPDIKTYLKYKEHEDNFTISFNVLDSQH